VPWPDVWRQVDCIVRPASETFFGGNGGYIQDFDGHLWGILYNPGLLPDEDASLHDGSTPPR
jgi:hypothetical protein